MEKAEVKLVSKKIGLFTKFRKKICRELSTSGWISNNLRVIFLRAAGATVGNDVYLGPCWRLYCDYGEEYMLTIEDRAAIGSSIVLSSYPNKSRVAKYFPNIVKVGKVHIETDAYCGMNSMILPGIKVGKCSIIGAGSLVIKDVPPFTIVGGIPAKEISKANMKKTMDKSQ